MFHQFRREVACRPGARRSRHCPRHGTGISVLEGDVVLSCAAGRWRTRDRPGRGCEQIHQGLMAYHATGAEVLRPYFLALLAEAYGTMGQPAGRPHGARGSADARGQNRRTLGTSPRSIASKARCCCNSLQTTTPRHTPASSTPSTWRVPSRPGRWNCAPPPASHASGSSRASAMRPVSCWPRSTTGSPRALTPPTSRRPGRCLTNSHHKGTSHRALLQGAF